MPNRDGTGPSGDGRPGRGLGNCGKSRLKSSATRDTSERRIIDTGAEILVDLVKALITKKTDKKRS